jgi:Intu longin-like domain 2
LISDYNEKFPYLQTLNVPFERKEKDKKEYFEYYCDDVHEAVYKKVIQRAYRHFRLFSNSFESNILGETDDEKLQTIRGKLDSFYSKYLLTMNLQSADIVDSIECLQYKPITHLIFFRIVSFMNMVTSIKGLHIKKCIFLYNNQEVVYSSLNPSDLYVLNEFLNESLFPKYLQRRNNQNQTFDTDRNEGCFVMEHENEKIQSAPKIYLKREGTRNEFDVYRLIIYSVLDVSLAMLIEGKKTENLLIYENIESSLNYRCQRTSWRRILQRNQVFSRTSTVANIKRYLRKLSSLSATKCS